VDGHGQAESFPYTRVKRVIIPQDSDCVWVRVYYFSREYPEFTGQSSQWDDTISYRVWSPNETIASGSANVNSLHDLFSDGPYHGGTYRVVDEIVDYSSLTASGDSWIDLRGTATNISDDAL